MVQPDFNDAGWKTGGAPFADDRQKAKTFWNTNDLWVRRTFTLKENESFDNLFLKINHDDNIDIYLNGQPIYHKQGWVNNYTYLNLGKELKANLKAGKNVLAFHVRNTAGGRFLDAGIVSENRNAGQQNDRGGGTAGNRRRRPWKQSTGSGAEKVDLVLTFTSPLLLKDSGAVIHARILHQLPGKVQRRQ